MTIGNFNDDANTDTLIIQKNKGYLSYYYFDDVAVTEYLGVAAKAGKDTIICLGDSVKLGAPITSGLQYHWSPAASLSDTSAAQPYARPTVTTSYFLTVTDTAVPGQCSITRDTITISICDSGPDSIRLYPSLNNGSFKLEYILSAETGGVFEVFNMIGQKVLEYSLRGGAGSTLSIQSGLGPGVYYWRVMASNAICAEERLVITN